MESDQFRWGYVSYHIAWTVCCGFGAAFSSLEWLRLLSVGLLFGATATFQVVSELWRVRQCRLIRHADECLQFLDRLNKVGK